MKDKLTKKRIKVDYESMIVYLKLDSEFVRYMFSKDSKISMRRMSLAFLRSKKINIEQVYFEMKEKGLFVDNDRNPLSKVYLFDDVSSGSEDTRVVDNSDFF